MVSYGTAAGAGIVLGFGPSATKIEKNNISKNNKGISFWYNSSGNIVKNNSIEGNYYGGIWLIFSSNNNEIVGNFISNNKYSGIALSDSSNYNIITENSILTNEKWGAYIYQSKNNKIYHNNFLDNKENANSLSFPENIWDDGYPAGGNFWSDYLGEDLYSGPNQDQVGSDCIGDSPYTFYGGQDNYPWIKQDGWKNQPPTISNLNQYKSDGQTAISEEVIITDDIVVFKAVVSDPNNDQVKLEVELRLFQEPFTGIDDGGILSSDFVNSGNEASIIRYGLVEGQYHWRARAVDSRGAISDWQEFGEIGNVDFSVVPLSQAAADLAKLVIDGPYLGDGDTFGGKGWDPIRAEYVAANLILNGYNFWNNKLRLIDFGVGLDCSGLTQWAYNYSFDPKKSLLHNVIRWDGADGQYKNNTETITEADLHPGDLLFLDKDSNNRMDHVAMYVGNNEAFDIVEAFSPERGIITSAVSLFKKRTGFVESKHFRRVVLSPSIGGFVKASSLIDLIITDPDGFTITPTTAIQTDEEYLREIPGELYYTENVLGIDDRPEDVVYWLKQKTGDYIIKVLPEDGATPTEIYSLEFTVGEQTTILADGIPLSQIPSNGYGVNVTDIGIISTFMPIIIDIKPGSFPNSINLKSNGVTPVAILGAATFDVKQIDLPTVKLAYARIKIKKNGQLMAGYEDVNKDGFIDVVVHIVTEELQLTSSDARAELNGFLLDGKEIKGLDSVRIVP